MNNRYALIHVPVSNGVVRVQTDENDEGAREARCRSSHSMPGAWYGGAMRWSGLRNSVRCAGGGAVAGRRFQFQTCRPGCRADEQSVEAEVTGDAGLWANWRSESSSDVDRDAAMLDEACGCCAGRVWRDLEAPGCVALSRRAC